ncbi:MAG: hypothetical protein AAGI89_06010 [Pseudomonadota bacterium]
MRDPEAVLKAFKQRADEAARRVADLRMAREKALQDQVDALRSIEMAFDAVTGSQEVQHSAGTYARHALNHAAHMRDVVEHIARQEDEARRTLHELYADQKRFEIYLAQRQRKAAAVARMKEEAELTELASLLHDQERRSAYEH